MSHLPHPQSSPSAPSRTDRTKLMAAALFTLAISAASLGVAIVFYLVTLSQKELDVQKSQMVNLADASEFKDNGHFLACATEAGKIPEGSPLYAEARSVFQSCRQSLDQDQLAIVRQLQAQNRLEEAIAQVTPLVGGTLDAEARRLMEEMAVKLLETAQRQYQTASPDYLNHALFSLKAIPETSAYFPTAAAWSREWREENARNYSQIQAAWAELKQGNIGAVEQALGQISRHPVWQASAASVRQELAALKTYQDAQAFMKNKEWENAIAAAMALPDLMPWAERKVDVISRSQATLERQAFCKSITLGLIQQCYL